MRSQLTQLIHWINQQGWSPATSTNYSYREEAASTTIYVSRSGIDKSTFKNDDFIAMNLHGEHQPGYEDIKPSAETGIHLMLYKNCDCRVVLHTHSLADTLLSRYHHIQGNLTLSGYELLKGLRGIDTHMASTIIPIFDNDQDIARLSNQMHNYLKEHPECQGLLIERHGFYCWGRDLAEAKRHLEVFQFLFTQELEWIKLREA